MKNSSILMKLGTCLEKAENFMENLYSVKCYDKTNMKVFALSLCEISAGA